MSTAGFTPHTHLDTVVRHVEELERLDAAELDRHVGELVVGHVQAAQRLNKKKYTIILEESGGMVKTSS